MKLYFAGAETKSRLKAITEAGGGQSLYSYYYLTKGEAFKRGGEFLSLAKTTQGSIFLDSGAYTARHRGVDISISKYGDFIQENLSKISVYANLDVIGDHKATEINQRYMEGRGLSPLPTFHQGTPFSELSNLINEYGYIALGNISSSANDKRSLFKWLDTCFNIIQGSTKIHGFGMTGAEVLKRYPWYSVDSTSWIGRSMRGDILRYQSGRLITIKTSKEAHADHRSILLNDSPGSKQWYNRVVENAKAFVQYQDYITKLWELRGVKWDNDERIRRDDPPRIVMPTAMS